MLTTILHHMAATLFSDSEELTRAASSRSHSSPIRRCRYPNILRDRAQQARAGRRNIVVVAAVQIHQSFLVLTLNISRSPQIAPLIILFFALLIVAKISSLTKALLQRSGQNTHMRLLHHGPVIAWNNNGIKSAFRELAP